MRCTSAPRPTTCCSRSTRTCTRSGRAPIAAHVLRDPASVGAELVHADRGGDVTYHGPGQLVGYPIVSLAEWRAGQRDVVAYVRKLESVLIAVLADFGISGDRRAALHGCVGRRREGRRDRRARRARPHPPRLRAQRRSRPHDVRAHRPVRHPRPGRHVDGAPARRGAADARGRRPGDRALRRGVRRGAGRSPGRRVAGRRRRSRAVHARRVGRRSGATARPARGGGRRAAGRSGPAPSGVDEGARPLRRRVPRAQEARARSRPAHGVRGGRAARTSTSAGPTAPPRS